MNDRGSGAGDTVITPHPVELTSGAPGGAQPDNAAALEALLEGMRRASGGVRRDAGTRFETLVRDWLRREPAYRDLFSKVQTYRDWSDDHTDLTTTARDIGIDLVATLADGSGYAAVQCKLYARNATVPKADVDSFLAASSRSCFKTRLLIATNDRWSDNAREELASVSPPVTLITRTMLGQSMIDWSAYAKEGAVRERPRRTPRPYQREAVADVVRGFEAADRGKLIMACGTGKTFTSLKIAEAMEGAGGFVLFLVPSLALLSQTLADWKQQCRFPITAFAVCSDVQTGKADAEKLDSLVRMSDLAYPATTSAKALAARVKASLERQAAEKKAMTVVFSTYHSLDVISRAQKEFGMPDIGLVVCDEAHRTAGGFLKDDPEKPFTRVHRQDFLRARKRLYMTATPRVWGEKAKQQADAGDAVLFSMDDEKVFGKTFHQITFTQAVQDYDCLVDYKVIVLTVDEETARSMGAGGDSEAGGLSVSNAAKVIGTWRALSKQDLQFEKSLGDDLAPMRRAVGFAQVIDPSEKYDRASSKAFAANFEKVIENFRSRREEEIREAGDGLAALNAFEEESRLVCETEHIDGSMDAGEKDQRLTWLREEPGDDTCRILFNVRCLSEGVDVPALDAVVFLSPRKSPVEVVQIVGRVMRRAPGKRRGYVIIPIVTKPNVAADLVLDQNKDFETVWQVLNALKSIDSEFGTMVDGQFEKINGDKMEVICLSDDVIRGRSAKDDDGLVSGKSSPSSRRAQRETDRKIAEDRQGAFDFARDAILEEAIKARIVRRVGNRREWSDWAEDVGGICREQIRQIEHVIETSESSRKAFESFRTELQETLGGTLSDAEVVEMLGQHVVTKPILDALFREYPFTEQNPIARAMTSMVEQLDREGMKKSTRMLEGFYESVRRRMAHVRTSAERQVVIKELFEKFFKGAFPKLQEKLGIVYTPVEVVDFINRSVADLLQKEFGQSIADPGVHILDPFTGTGTFLARLMQSGLIPKDRLPEKFRHELHANEIMPLAYYVASMNLESVFHEECPGEPFAPNPVMVWTDTFADVHRSDLFETSLAENNARLAAQESQDIRVIIGNPPYSVGQESQNDDNQNDHYEKLDSRIRSTYADNSTSTSKIKLYDSYIRAYRWASDRIKDKGIIGFVTNAGWLDSTSADGMRKCMAEEFSSIYIYHLKGNQRTSGERSRKEGGKIFGEGSRSPVSIVFLVKNPESPEKGKIYFHAVGDYLSREEKLETLSRDRSMVSVSTESITPDAHSDWFNLRDNSFSRFMRTDGKNTTEKSIFRNFSLGVFTSRDGWAYASGEKPLFQKMQRCICFYNEQVNQAEILKDQFQPDLDPTKLKWDVPQKRGVYQGKKAPDASRERIYKCLYRPFFPQFLYHDRFWNGRVYQMPSLFPENTTKNLIICINQNAKDSGQIALIADKIVDLHFLGDSQCFPRWLPGAPAEPVGLFQSAEENRGPSGFTPEALPHFQAAYPGKMITEDDLFFYIYGLLHSEDYRTRYANNLMKELPRIPRVATYEQFRAFSQAGRRLADLHVHFEKVAPYAGAEIEYTRPGEPSWRVRQMKWGKIPGKTGNAAKDKTTLIYNEWITVRNLPLEAQEYVVNKKSALDWIVEFAAVRTDKKGRSGIVNNFNDYADEVGNERYPLELFLRVVTVSLETMKIVKSLPPLEIHPLDR